MSSLLAFLLHAYQVFILLFIGALIVGALWKKREKRRRDERGFWVESIRGIPLGADPDDFAIVYHEGEKCQFFYGEIVRATGPSDKDVENLRVPDEEQWRQQMPDWLQGKRELVLQRIQETRRWVRFVTESQYTAP